MSARGASETGARRRAVALVLGLVVLIARTTPAAAHLTSLGRSIITLDDDQRGAEIRVTVSRLDLDALRAQVGDPSGVTTALADGLILDGPGGRCRATTPVALPAADGQAAFRWRVRCPAPPDRLRCDLLVDIVPGHVHLARIVGHGHGTVIALGADRREARLDRPGAVAGSGSFVTLGVRHVGGGPDHLLFLLTLLLVSASLRELALAATGFTVGHSVALALAVALGVRPSAAGIELLVAASIAVVAAEAAGARAGRAGRRVPLVAAGGLAAVAGFGALAGGPAPLALLGLALFAGCYLTAVQRAPDGRRRIAVTALFGLVHGFAFAGPLLDLELRGWALARSLVGFNLGLELAQLTILVTGWMLVTAARRRAPAFAALAVDVAAAVAIAPATYWLLMRSA